MKRKAKHGPKLPATLAEKVGAKQPRHTKRKTLNASKAPASQPPKSQPPKSSREEEEAVQRKLLGKLGNTFNAGSDNLMDLAPARIDTTASSDDDDDDDGGAAFGESDSNDRLHKDRHGSALASQSSEKMQHQVESDPDASQLERELAQRSKSTKRTSSDGINAIQRIVKRCINTLGSSNIDVIVSRLTSAMQESGTEDVISCLCNEVPRCLSAGPRQGSNFIASLGTALACVASVSGDASAAARLLSCVTCTLHSARHHSDSASSYNCVCLLAVLFEAGLLGSWLIWDIADSFANELSETDVAQLLLLVRACGPTLREHDPSGFKAFLERHSYRIGELKAAGSLPTRARLLLDLLIDIKNNKWRGRGSGNSVPSLSQSHKKLVSRLSVHSSVGADISTARLDRLLNHSPDMRSHNDRVEGNQGHRCWWEMQLESSTDSTANDFHEITGREDYPSTEKLMRHAIGARDEHEELLDSLAEQQRLNAGSRREVFKAVANAEDYAHAAEGLQKLRLGKAGEAEAVRVIIELCAQEAKYNKFYELLLSHLATTHRPKATRRSITSAFCDQWRSLKSESSNRRAMHTGRLCGALIGRRSVRVSALKSAKLADPSLPKHADLHFKELVRTMLKRSGSEQSASIIGQHASSSENLRRDLSAFVSARILTSQPADNPLPERHTVARKAKALLQGLEIGLQAS
jgi:nucleolar MIF4G domain-containing protein 1